MMKRRRGRPRKIHSHNFAEEMPNGNVSNSDNLPEFFKIYMPALSSKLLRIPPDFIDKFGGNIPTTCTIERPQGVSWQVGITKVNDCWFFEKGWPNFVEDNSLRDGDFLTFCYLGKSLFYVKIFSPNGCAKGDYQTCQSGENCEMNGTKHSRRGRPVVYINGNPSFSLVLMKSHIHKYKGVSHLPVKFWSAHVKNNISRVEVTLLVENQAWNLGVVNYGYRIVLQKGWPKFVKDNSLKVGTSCTFQLIDAKHLSFIVTFGRDEMR